MQGTFNKHHLAFIMARKNTDKVAQTTQSATVFLYGIILVSENICLHHSLLKK